MSYFCNNTIGVINFREESVQKYHMSRLNIRDSSTSLCFSKMTVKQAACQSSGFNVYKEMRDYHASDTSFVICPMTSSHLFKLIFLLVAHIMQLTMAHCFDYTCGVLDWLWEGLEVSSSAKWSCLEP